MKEGSAFGLAVDEHVLFNPNGAILNELPIDVLAQLTREEGPAYTAKRMEELAAAGRGRREPHLEGLRHSGRPAGRAGARSAPTASP